MRAVPCAPFRKFKEVLENPSKSERALSAAGHKPCQLNWLHLIDYQEGSQESDGAADLQSGSSLLNTHKRIRAFPPLERVSTSGYHRFLFKRVLKVLGGSIPVGPLRKMQRASLQGARELLNLAGIARNHRGVGTRKPSQNNLKSATTRFTAAEH